MTALPSRVLPRAPPHFSKKKVDFGHEATQEGRRKQDGKTPRKAQRGPLWRRIITCNENCKKRRTLIPSCALILVTWFKSSWTTLQINTETACYSDRFAHVHSCTMFAYVFKKEEVSRYQGQKHLVSNLTRASPELSDVETHGYLTIFFFLKSTHGFSFDGRCWAHWVKTKWWWKARQFRNTNDRLQTKVSSKTSSTLSH